MKICLFAVALLTGKVTGNAVPGNNPDLGSFACVNFEDDFDLAFKCPKIAAKCAEKLPLPPPTDSCPDGIGDTCVSLNGSCKTAGVPCCDGLACYTYHDGSSVCQPLGFDFVKEGKDCKGTFGGCGSGEACCGDLTCHWAPGNHRRCLPPCVEEHKKCSADGECCSGLSCENGSCVAAPSNDKGACSHPELGVVENNACVKGTISGTCVSACCTNCRLSIRYTPIALDMDGTGLVETVKHVDLKFDINGDGSLEDVHEWFAPTEGILVNTNIDGPYLSGAHLFGDEGGKYEDGFDKLSHLDANQDGIVSGSELKGLKLWFDANTNAYLDEEELHDLSEFGIISLSLYNENLVGHATKKDGRQIRMEDLWFQGDDANEIASAV